MMAESSKQPNPWGLWPLLAVFLVVSGYIQLMPKLESSRPAGERAGLDKAEPGQAVRARLWEDPLSAVADGAGHRSNLQPAQKSKPEQGDGNSMSVQASLKTTLDEFKAKNKLGSDTQILALAAMIDGGPYPEDFETRQRTRQAVLSALGAEEFVPHDADHLEYFVFQSPKQPAHPMYVPYEWYELVDAKSHRLVLLLWVNESEIESGYLGWMTDLSKQLSDVFVKRSPARIRRSGKSRCRAGPAPRFPRSGIPGLTTCDARLSTSNAKIATGRRSGSSAATFTIRSCSSGSCGTTSRARSYSRRISTHGCSTRPSTRALATC